MLRQNQTATIVPRSLSNPLVTTTSVNLGLVCLLVLSGCATTEEQRFPLDYISGHEAAYQLDTAREALPAYQRMGADLERRGRYPEAATAYSNARQSAQTLGRLQDALDAGQKAVQMAERGGNPVQLSIALNRLGHTQISLNAPQKAISLFERAATLDVEIENPAGKASSYTGLSKAYRSLGNREMAAKSAMKGVAILEGAIPAKSIQWSRAGTQGRRWLRTLEESYMEALWVAGFAHFALSQREQARVAFQKALEVGTRISVPRRMAQAHLGLGRIAADEGKWQTAASHLEEAIRLNPGPELVASAQGWLGRVYRGMGKLAQAEQALRQAVAGFEDLRSLLQSEGLRESFFEDKVTPYELLVLTLIEQGKPAEAFDMSERARSRAFLDLLGNRVTLSAGRSQALLAEERALRERISALKAQSEDSQPSRRELELAREAYQAFLQRVRQVDREQAALMTVEPLTLGQVQALLPDGSILLEYFVTGQGKTLLWTVERESVSVVIIPLGRRGVSDRVQAFREAIASRERGAETARMARDLFDRIVRPGLQGRTPKELLLVPHDALHYLPYQALMPAPGRYLIQDTPLYFYSSASLIQFTRTKAQNPSPTLFALGNPDLHDPTLNLRFAEREVRMVADLFPGTIVATGSAATKAATYEQSPHQNILHFATHAELDEQDPLGSALRLTPSSGDDGRLEVQEIFGLNLHASLVVLSACETALGSLTQGDELTGLTRAFIYAGTPSIITTLWQVSDRASYELMQEFYHQFKAGKDKAEALRQAQLATLQKHPAPYYWAAYQLTGEAR